MARLVRKNGHHPGAKEIFGRSLRLVCPGVRIVSHGVV